MSKIIVVTSGKGGVGKTTTTSSLGVALAQYGEKTVVVDFDIGLRNLDLVMGVEHKVVHDLVHVIQDGIDVKKALIQDSDVPTLYTLAASQTRDKDVLSFEGVKKVLDELKKDFDYILCDSPAGIEQGAKIAMHFADEAVIVTNPEVSSVRDSDRILGMLDSTTARAKNGEDIKKHLLITRYNPTRAATGEMLSVEDISNILSLEVVGIIPESQNILKSSNIGRPVTILAPYSEAGQAYNDVVKRLLGRNVELRIPAEKKNVFGRIFGSK